MDPTTVKTLKEFVAKCRKNPMLLHDEELEFFRDFLVGLGAELPEPGEESFMNNTRPNMDDNEEMHSPKDGKTSDPEPEPESEESDVELDMTGVVAADTDCDLEMGDKTIVEPTEDMLEQSGDFRMKAMEAQNEGNLDEAIKNWTEAIKTNPQSAVLHAKRANVLLKMEKPMAAIRDANAALELNPDQALAYKCRGRAYRLLGKFEEAAHDLSTACNIDYSDEANDWLKEVQPNVKKIHDHKRKWERKREERELNERRERIRKAQEDRARQQAEEKEFEGMPDLGGMGGMPGMGGMGGMPGMGGMGGMPAGMGEALGQLLKDPEIISALSDPEVRAAYADISQNPANIMKYQSNPKVMALVTKMAKKMGGGNMPGMGGMSGGPMGGIFG